jgi:hypothetical protein
VASGIVVAAAVPASAAECRQDSTPDRFCEFTRAGESVDVAIAWTGVNGSITSVHGTITHLPPTQPMPSSTVFVQQCTIVGGRASRCGVVAASRRPIDRLPPSAFYGTSQVTAAHGHVYRACASWTTANGWHAANQCSPFVAA